MQTKSKLQLIKEEFNIKEQFKDKLTYLTDKYLVEDSVFKLDGSNSTECRNGYFAIVAEYNSLDEAMKNFSIGDSIRIIENTAFQVGKTFDKLSKIDESYSKVMDITTGVIMDR